MEKVDVRPGEKVGGWVRWGGGGGGWGPQRLSDTVQKLSYRQPLIPPHHLNPDTTSTPQLQHTKSTNMQQHNP